MVTLKTGMHTNSASCEDRRRMHLEEAVRDQDKEETDVQAQTRAVQAARPVEGQGPCGQGLDVTRSQNEGRFHWSQQVFR